MKIPKIPRDYFWSINSIHLGKQNSPCQIEVIIIELILVIDVRANPILMNAIHLRRENTKYFSFSQEMNFD